MGVKVFRSTLTWRSLEYQDSVLAPVVPGWPDVPVYTGENDLVNLLRPTTRKTPDSLYMASLALLAKNEEDFKENMKAMLKRNMVIIAIEDNWNGGQLNAAVKEWKTARRKDHGKHGGEKSAAAKKIETNAAIELIRDRWPMPSKDWSTDVLLKEADRSLNTVKAILGPRPIAQYNYRTKHVRQIKQAETNPKPREKMDFCGVYVFQIEEGIYKIGSSNHSGRRFKQVSAHHKKQMKVVELFNMDMKMAVAVEAEVHNRLHKHRAHEYNGREIFRVSLETVKRAVNRAIKVISKGPKYE